ncbi:polysaccharide deacetylase family protein [Brevibacillus sp. B_LB10_24]|uniref:polysaccharide deacetylase family protein n=1 Tax=Brevibacillus sp. B_LB10_24 TaxID=3380645 RepID=UPI0038BA8C9B
MFRISCPPTFLNERGYIFDVLFSQFLGIEYISEAEPRSDVRIMLADDSSEKELTVADVFFQQPEQDWLQPASLPRQPLMTWDAICHPCSGSLVSANLPVIYGKRLANGSFIESGQESVRLGIDIFGSAFYMLARYEEAVRPDRDQRERFPAGASLAFQEGFLDRPIVNEYLEVLWWSLRQLWPNLRRKRREYRFLLSHDVDWPLGIAPSSLPQVLRATAGDVLKRSSWLLAARRIQSLIEVRRGRLGADLCNTFDWMMTLSEKRGLASSFFFITDHTGGEIDGAYSVDDPWIQTLMKQIHDRGHQIGLHPSYHTFRDPNQLQREYNKLREAMDRAGIGQEKVGGRQHFLRWEAPTTWQIWDEAGLFYDSTLSFADRAGFRCGTCYEYSVYNVKTRRALKLLERPLIVMEGTLLDEHYLHLSRKQAKREIDKLRNRCRQFGGDFTLLWHNHSLIHPLDAKLYQAVVLEADLSPDTCAEAEINR